MLFQSCRAAVLSQVDGVKVHQAGPMGRALAITAAFSRGPAQEGRVGAAVPSCRAAGHQLSRPRTAMLGLPLALGLLLTLAEGHQSIICG